MYIPEALVGILDIPPEIVASFFPLGWDQILWAVTHGKHYVDTLAKCQYTGNIWLVRRPQNSMNVLIQEINWDQLWVNRE